MNATSDDSTRTIAPKTVQTDTTTRDSVFSCYAHQTSNNLVMLRLKTISHEISGHLTYDIMGKDKNDGTIMGSMHGDTLIAHYKFMSEGKQSVRQIAFLRRGNAFVEGYGDMEQKGDSMVFSRIDSLSFNGTIVLEQVPCPLQ
jgi:hypothetical protein